jgi:transposase-like protein
MAPWKPKPRQPSMSKAELRAQGVQALAQASKPVMKLPMKVKRQCGRCDRFNTVVVEPGAAVPAFQCSACGYSAARP